MAAAPGPTMRCRQSSDLEQGFCERPGGAGRKRCMRQVPDHSRNNRPTAPLAGGLKNAPLLFASPVRGGGSRQRTGGVGPQAQHPPAPAGQPPLQGGLKNAPRLFASPERGGGSRQRIGGVGPQVQHPPAPAGQPPLQEGLSFPLDANWYQSTPGSAKTASPGSAPHQSSHPSPSPQASSAFKRTIQPGSGIRAASVSAAPRAPESLRASRRG